MGMLLGGRLDRWNYSGYCGRYYYRCHHERVARLVGGCQTYRHRDSPRRVLLDEAAWRHDVELLVIAPRFYGLFIRMAMIDGNRGTM